MNQSKHQVITCSWRKVRENTYEWITIGFGFTPDWMKKWREFFNQSHSVANAKPITFRHSNENRSNSFLQSLNVQIELWENARSRPETWQLRVGGGGKKKRGGVDIFRKKCFSRFSRNWQFPFIWLKGDKSGNYPDNGWSSLACFAFCSRCHLWHML